MQTNKLLSVVSVRWYVLWENKINSYEGGGGDVVGDCDVVVASHLLDSQGKHALQKQQSSQSICPRHSRCMRVSPLWPCTFLAGSRCTARQCQCSPPHIHRKHFQIQSLRERHNRCSQELRQGLSICLLGICYRQQIRW